MIYILEDLNLVKLEIECGYRPGNILYFEEHMVAQVEDFEVGEA